MSSGQGSLQVVKPKAAAAEFHLVIDAVTEIEEDKAERAAAQRQAGELAVAEDGLGDLEGPEEAAVKGDAVARAMELLDGLANEQVPTAKAAVEQRRRDAVSPATVDGGDVGVEQSDSGSEMEENGDDDRGCR
jgi:hypothetical protein